ncbi:MAG: GntR family transcriptional regulator [Syntrophomonadaceae bacterium]|nr:GntR family transcriptional regulator [Syntrophomonadaceae bacterium]
MVERRLKPIDFQVYNKPLHGIVLEILREAIVSGLLRPGEKLMEAQLAEEMGISRTPVREAIRKLELEGFVNMIPRKGACVAEYSEKDIVDTFRIRLALERLAVELAVGNITSGELEELKRVLEDEERSIEGLNLEAMVEKDAEFHEVIYRAGGNPRLLQIMENLRGQISRFRFVSLGGRGRGREVLVEHGRIYEALKQRNLELVLECIEEHIRNTQQALMAAIREQQAGKQ